MKKSSKKPLCVHFHIFKNAGTTIDYILERNFLKDAIRMDTGKPDGRLDFGYLKELHKIHPLMKSFSSHQIRFPIPESNTFDFFPMIFIRHPIDRAASVYFFNRKQPGNKNNKTIQKAKDLSLGKYLEWLLSLKNSLIVNMQTHFLSGKPDKDKVNFNDYENSKRILNKCSILGIVERMDESLVLVEKVLKPYFENIDFSYTKKNVSQERKGGLKERIENIKKEIGQEVYEELKKANEFDFKLYEYANEVLDQRLSTIENLEEKLKEFKQRCNKLSSFPEIQFNPLEKYVLFENPNNKYAKRLPEKNLYF